MFDGYQRIIQTGYRACSPGGTPALRFGVQGVPVCVTASTVRQGNPLDYFVISVILFSRYFLPAADLKYFSRIRASLSEPICSW